MLGFGDMAFFGELKRLNPIQRHTFAACFLGWTLDAFDFFLLTVCLKAIAADFHVGIPTIAEAIFWTLVMRPLGALDLRSAGGTLRPTADVDPEHCLFLGLRTGIGVCSFFATFLICRALFGVAMGGEWGVGAALALESLPASGRGFFSGILQEGYVVGNLLAGALYWLLFPHLHGTGMLTGWRVMFMIGALPALLAFYMQFKVKESPIWLEAEERRRAGRSGKSRIDFSQFVTYLPTFLFLVLLMTCFNSFSHGTQDLYPTLLEKDHGLAPGRVGMLIVIANIGALIGGIFCGAMSERSDAGG